MTTSTGREMEQDTKARSKAFQALLDLHIEVAKLNELSRYVESICADENRPNEDCVHALIAGQWAQRRHAILYDQLFTGVQRFVVDYGLTEEAHDMLRALQ